MSELEEIATYRYMWNAVGDACPKCRSLHGYDFGDQDIFNERLFSRIWGDVWDFDADHSLAHGAQQYNCRCQLTVRVEFDWNRWRELQEMRQTITRYGKHVTVTRSRKTGRFV